LRPGPEKCRELLEGEGVSFEDGKANPSRRISWEELEKHVQADDSSDEAA
jgi:hypothetical protein